GAVQIDVTEAADPDPYDPSPCTNDPTYGGCGIWTAAGGDSDGGESGAGVSDTTGPPCIDGRRDVTPAEGQQIITNASTHIGTPFVYGPGKMFCTGLACVAIRPLVPKFPEGKAATWGNHSSLRVLGSTETTRSGDIIRFPGHVGLYDPSH